MSALSPAVVLFALSALSAALCLTLWFVGPPRDRLGRVLPSSRQDHDNALLWSGVSSLFLAVLCLLVALFP